MTIAAFAVRRLAAMVAILLVVSFLIFGLLAVIPGDPARTLLGPAQATPEALGRIRAEYRLDEPFLAQYWYWLTGAVQGDFGRSISSGQSVAQVLGERFPVTATLGVYSFVLTVLIAIPAGLASGVRRGGVLDRTVTATSLVGLSAPTFAVAVLLIYVFAVQLDLFPAFGAGDGTLDRLYHLTLPALAMAIGQIAIVARQTRAATLEVATRDYVTFARARAISVPTIWRRYVLRNAALPVVTISGLILAFGLTGAVLVESAFALPGIGALLVEAVVAVDIPVVQALAMLTAVIVLAVNLVVDVSYFLLDPRLRRTAVS